MSKWPSVKAGKIFRALIAIGWDIKRHKNSSHIIMCREGWPDYVWAFSSTIEIGPKMLARISKHTGLKPEDL